MNRITLLNVGHGNCAVIDSDDSIAIVDAPSRAPLLQFLDEHPEKTVRSVLVSHSDNDHLAGLAALLTSHRVHVQEVWANPDPNRTTLVWRQFYKALRSAGGTTKLYPSLTSTTPGTVTHGQFTLQVISPLPHMALLGYGNEGYTANSLSAVVRVLYDGKGEVLLAADMDRRALDVMAEDPNLDLRARILVFPHHGGRAGARNNFFQFAFDLTRRVAPEWVIFSIGRHGGYRNPRPDVVDGVRAAAPNAHIACTQMSQRCTSHTNSLPDENRCSGSIEVTFPGPTITPSVEEHEAIIGKHADLGKALCIVPLAGLRRP